ncbi:MAG: acyltransferase [Gemmatimonadaceae bacterium]|nr:acyltransferase [Gemmatimonadaceae bacterium]
MRPHHSQYRRDLDGLRALAVGAVIVNHAFPAVWPAGFVGVDIFFVLSGFLITRIVVSERRRETFSFVEFYFRRCRRILPALVLVLTCTWVAGAIVLTSPEFESLGNHLVAASVFSSNLLLWREVGYFDGTAVAKPLLHLWSLGVEEQFYLLWPLIALSVATASSRTFKLVLALAAASFALSITQVTSHNASAFYLLPSRFWELLVGGLLAFRDLSRSRDGTIPESVGDVTSRGRASFALLGILLIGAAFLWIDEASRFPGYWVLLPVLGTALLIEAGPSTWIGRRLFGNRAMVAIGLISYPLYLWHWPMLSLFRLVGFDLGLTVADMLRWKIGLLALAVTLAAGTYRFVEMPIQRAAQRVGGSRTRQAFGIAALCSPLCLLGLLGFSTARTGGYPQRVPNLDPGLVTELRNGRRAISVREAQSVPCQPAADRIGVSWCFRSSQRDPDIAVWGDSHAWAMSFGLGATLVNRSVLLVAQSECPPVLGERFPARSSSLDCASKSEAALSFLGTQGSVKTVVIVSRGPLYVEGSDFGKGNAPLNDVLVDGTLIPFLGNRAAMFESGLARAVERLLGFSMNVVLALDVPELGFSLSECVVARPLGLTQLRTDCATPYQAFLQRNARYHAIVRRVASHYPNVRVWDASEPLCESQSCVARLGKHLLYVDDDHLSLYGSQRVAGGLERILRGLEPSAVPGTAPLR